MSTFTSLLKKLGQILAVGLEITGFISPVVLPLLGSSKAGAIAGKAINDFTAIGTTVVQIETAMQGKPGPEKLAAASTLVRSIVQTSELVSGHKIANEAEFIAGNVDLTNAIVRIMNSLAADNLKTSGNADPMTVSAAATPVPAV